MRQATIFIFPAGVAATITISIFLLAGLVYYPNLQFLKNSFTEAFCFANPLIANIYGQWQPNTKRNDLMSTEDNKFIDNLYHEFEQNLFKVFGFGIEDLKKVLDRPDTPERRGHDLDAELQAAFDAGGAPQLRWQMNNVIACLEFVYMIDRLDRKPTYDEWAHRVEELNIGMTRDDLVPFDE